MKNEFVANKGFLPSENGAMSNENSDLLRRVPLMKNFQYDSEKNFPNLSNLAESLSFDSIGALNFKQGKYFSSYHNLPFPIPDSNALSSSNLRNKTIRPINLHFTYCL